MKTTAGMARLSKAASPWAMTSAATLPSRLALCASMGPVAASPMAKMFGSSVRQSGPVRMKPLSSVLTRVFCSPMSSVFGRRPMATSTCA